MEKEMISLIPLIGDGCEFDISFTDLTDKQRIAIADRFTNKRVVTVSLMDIETECYISFINIKKVKE